MNNRDWKPMRQGQQNRRGRGRNNNNNNNNNAGNQHRKGQNPLTRSFESNGPDMKIRGTPAHIAEKYIALARDAHSAGDPVLAENYLQHAEHYNRIILAYREQQMSQGGDVSMARPRPAQLQDPVDGEDGIDDDMPVDPAEAPQPQIRHVEAGQPQPQPQRIYDNQQRYDQPRDNRDSRDRGDRGGDRGDRDNRQQPRFGQDGQPSRRPHRDRFDRGDRGDRGFQGNRYQNERGDRFAPDRQQDRQQDRMNDGGDRGDRIQGERVHMERQPERAQPERGPIERAPHVERPQNERPERSERLDRSADVATPSSGDAEGGQTPRAEAPRRRERFAQAAHEQPEFLRRPVRRPRRETPPDDEAGPAAPAAPVAADESGRE